MKPGEYYEYPIRFIAPHPIVVAWDCSKDVRTAREGIFKKARLSFIDGSWLAFREFVRCLEREDLILRYDNTPHHPQLANLLHYKYSRSGLVLPCLEPDFALVLDEIESNIRSKRIK